MEQKFCRLSLFDDLGDICHQRCLFVMITLAIILMTANEGTIHNSIMLLLVLPHIMCAWARNKQFGCHSVITFSPLLPQVRSKGT